MLCIVSLDTLNGGYIVSHNLNISLIIVMLPTSRDEITTGGSLLCHLLYMSSVIMKLISMHNHDYIYMHVSYVQMM